MKLNGFVRVVSVLVFAMGIAFAYAFAEERDDRSGPVQVAQAERNKILKVTLLGTGGGPSAGLVPGSVAITMNTMTLVEAGEDGFLFDAGRGVTLRLGQLGRPAFAKTKRLYLTHLHSDHVTGVPELFLTGRSMGREVPLQVFGPKGTASMIFHLEKAYEYDLTYRSSSIPRSKIFGTDITEGVVLDQNGVKITAFKVPHYPALEPPEKRKNFPALGYRVDYAGRSVVISGDTMFSENLIKFSQGADVLIHEVILGGPPGTSKGVVQGPAVARQRLQQMDRDSDKRISKEEFLGPDQTFDRNDSDKDGFLAGEELEAPSPRALARAHHTAADDVGRVFAQVRPRLAVCNHIIKGRAPDQMLLRRIRGTYDGQLVLGKDMMVIEIGDEVRIDKPAGG
jgi:ribonuclease Z